VFGAVRAPVHETITSDALPFLKDDVLNEIIDANVNVDIYHPLDDSSHFDNSTFLQSMVTINGHYQNALDDSNPDDFDSDNTAEEFGALLHTVQDFYSHSNWVNYPELRDTLVDGGDVLWTTLAAPAGVTFLQGHSVADFSSFEVTADFRVLVGTASGISKGIVSGSFKGANQAPVDITHDQLNHDHNGDTDGDPPPRPLFSEARALAVKQTEHEFKRLAELVRARYGERGVDELICEWVKPDQASQDAARALAGGAALDLVFVIDTTGSMFDDIDAVKAAATQIINQISHDKPCTRIGIVLYKDAGDAYVTSTGLPFTTVGHEDGDTGPVISAIQSISVGGGGDIPEAVYAGLVHAIENKQGLGFWRGGTTRKAIILMGDAPPHDPDQATGDTLATVSQKAFDADPVDIYTVVVGNSGFIDPAARTTFQAIANANRGTTFTALSASGIVASLVEAIGDVIVPPTGNHAPELAAIGNRSINEGSTLSFTASAIDGDTGQHLRFSLDPGAPVGAAINLNTGAFTWTPPDGAAASSFSVTVRVTDDGSPNLSDFETFTVTVANLPPTASLAGPTSGVRGQSRLFSLHAADPSPIDQAAGFTYKIDWDGNGTVDQTVGPGASSSTAINHTYTTTGTFTVRMTATDKDGDASPVVTRVITITAVALQSDPIDPTKTALVVGGTTGNDHITFLPDRGPGGLARVQVVVNSVSLGTFGGVDRVVAYGQSGDDEIAVLGLNQPALLDGGEGSDTLYGGKGPNILLGGGGPDLMIGGGVRDLMIGGLGADELIGGRGDDVLIGGTTVHDANPAALGALLAEWARPISYAARVSHLDGSLSGGLNSGLLLTPGTVFDDSAIDNLYGDESTDWFFAKNSGPVKDIVRDRKLGEVLTFLP
jgi:hypothetical protein